MSEIRATTISDAAGTGPITLTKQSAAKAYGGSSTDGTTLTTSLNVSSLTDSSAGDRSFNLTNSVTDSDSPVQSGQASGYIGSVYSTLNTVSAIRIITYNTAGAKTDYIGTFSAHGDLA